MSDPVAVKRYAQALFGAAQKAEETEKVEKDLAALSRGFRRSGLKDFLKNPRHALQAKARVIDEVGKKMDSSVMVSFLHLLLRKSRTDLIPDISREFAELDREIRGIVPCEVVLAKEPEKAFIQKIEDALQRITGQKVDMTFRTDPGVIGGIAVRVKNRILDASFRARLSELRDSLLEARI